MMEAANNRGLPRTDGSLIYWANHSRETQLSNQEKELCANIVSYILVLNEADTFKSTSMLIYSTTEQGIGG
jgi:hypothetical protein